MDLTQTKLSKTEWNSIEIPVQEDEKTILKLIQDGYADIGIRVNQNTSMLALVKIDDTAENHAYLYKAYFADKIKEYMDSSSNSGRLSGVMPKVGNVRPPKKIDIMRLENMNSQIESQRANIFEYVLIDLVRMVLTDNSPKSLTKVGKPTDKVGKSTDKIGKSTDKIGKSLPSKSPKSLWTPPHSPMFALYTLIQLQKSTIAKLNTFVVEIVDKIIKYYVKSLTTETPETPETPETIIVKMFGESKEIIEKNPYLLKYSDRTLFDHQKRLFQIFRQSAPETKSPSKLVLYIAPTGTGKTLSPLGLSCGYRIIFVCVARHVGLALAKSAISMEKKVAFAFGCETAADIRLHYFAAADYSKNKRSGGIGKVDNSVGHKVEIMICDVQSYLTAMLYMLAFNDESQIITYWDEPTMTMDYAAHELHPIIARNWRENRISRVVFSCATLPKEAEIADTIMSFRNKFYNTDTNMIPVIHSIISYDCKKSIAILDKSMKCVLPHLMFADFAELQRSVEHCIANKSLLRYFDLSEIVRLVRHLSAENCLQPRFTIDGYFGSVADITMDNIKLYYLDVLKNIDESNWSAIFAEMTKQQLPKYIPTNSNSSSGFRKTQSADSVSSFSLQSVGEALRRTSSLCETRLDTNIVPPLVPFPSPVPPSPVHSLSTAGTLITTADAHTITDGPCIFLTEDPLKISKFFIQQANIPKKVLDQLLERIETNNTIQEKIADLDKALEDKLGTDADKDKKAERNAANDTYSPEIKRLKAQIEQLRGEIRMANMDACYVPNTVQHQTLWLAKEWREEWREEWRDSLKTAFIPRIDNQTVRDIMELAVDANLKLLLMIGVGVFAIDIDKRYLEIMKRLAYEQRLFLIIAAGDYIYGTNYQFAHGFLGKDLTSMTQQKTIQAMGRIGRGNIQQEYTIRFRDDTILRGLFLPQATNMEAEMMSKLMCD